MADQLIRPARVDDAPAILNVYRPAVESSTISFEYELPTVAETAERIAARWPQHPWFVAESDGEVAGYAYAGPFATRAAYAWTAETSVYLVSEAQGQGLATALYNLLLTTLQAQGFRQAIAIISLPNEPSVRLHERHGFRAAASLPSVGWKHGRWLTTGYWTRPLGQGSSTPVTGLPLGLDEITPTW